MTLAMNRGEHSSVLVPAIDSVSHYLSEIHLLRDLPRLGFSRSPPIGLCYPAEDVLQYALFKRFVSSKWDPADCVWSAEDGTPATSDRIISS